MNECTCYFLFSISFPIIIHSSHMILAVSFPEGWWLVVDDGVVYLVYDWLYWVKCKTITIHDLYFYYNIFTFHFPCAILFQQIIFQHLLLLLPGWLRSKKIDNKRKFSIKFHFNIPRKGGVMALLLNENAGEIVRFLLGCCCRCCRWMLFDWGLSKRGRVRSYGVKMAKRKKSISSNNNRFNIIVNITLHARNEYEWMNERWMKCHTPTPNCLLCEVPLLMYFLLFL